MAAYITLARPYAQAIFDHAQASQRLALWEDVLQVLGALGEDRVFCNLAANPQVDNKKLLLLAQDIVFDLVAPATSIQQPLGCFLSLLADSARLPILPAVFKLYRQFVARLEQTKHIEVIAAQPLSPQSQDDMKQALQKRFASKVELTFKEDRSLIGGALIRSGSWVMDGSIKGKLKDLSYLLRG